MRKLRHRVARCAKAARTVVGGQTRLKPFVSVLTDITHVRLNHGLASLVAVIDGYSCRVLAWRISNRMEAGFCVDCLQQALSVYGKREVFTSDQVGPFTGEAFTSVLKANSIKLSMDRRGRALNHVCNIFVERPWRTVKTGDGYLKGYATMGELLIALT